MTPVRQIILDTETTGLDANQGDRILEFAGLEMKNRHLTGKHLHLYIHPQRDVPAEAVAVHGLDLEKLESLGAKPFADVAGQIADFLRGAELIIHNAQFDVGFLNMEFARLGLPSLHDLGCTLIDTLAMAREQFPGQRVSLDALCQRLGVDRSKRIYHGALIDCELLSEVYLAMTRSQFSLDDAFVEAVTAQNVVAESARPAHLKVLRATDAELAEHQAYLDALDKASGSGSLWRQTEAGGEA